MSVPLPPQALDGALEHHLSPVAAGPGTQIDHVVGDGDGFGLVLHEQHGVALVAQLEQQLVHAGDVVGVQADGGLVEDVGDVGERRPEVADHLGALRLAARQGPGGAVEREVAQPDLDERVQRVAERREQRGHRRLVQPARPLGQVADLHGARAGDADAGDLGRAGRLVEPGAVAVGTGGEGDRPLHEGPDVGLHGLDVLGQV
ncbi:hypothetical protein KSP35_03890 [Aquihabitans sp. G128]|nr:hypothetical protein [Aquihabitans sp. G128]QXC61971.1 hypothetical protein KSP35_03890 [Aquihabitans sp. G128]